MRRAEESSSLDVVLAVWATVFIQLVSRQAHDLAQRSQQRAGQFGSRREDSVLATPSPCTESRCKPGHAPADEVAPVVGGTLPISTWTGPPGVLVRTKSDAFPALTSNEIA